MGHIVASGYSKYLFPGTSMYSLLVSIPIAGRVDYSKTLRIAYDEIAHVVTFNTKQEKTSVWETTCQPSEVIDTFEHFLKEHPEWSELARRTHLAWLRFDTPRGDRKPTSSAAGDVFWRIVGKALSLIIPQANPDFDRLIEQVAFWMVEYDKTLDATTREIGFDVYGHAILAMPLNRNYGYWTDNQLKLSDYDRFNPIPITEREFDTAWLKFTSEWKEP